MPKHSERRALPYTPEQLFDLVAEVERYPEFLPWCLATRIRARDEYELTADMIVGYKMFRETFTSRVQLERPGRIEVEYLDGATVGATEGLTVVGLAVLGTTLGYPLATVGPRVVGWSVGYAVGPWVGITVGNVVG